VYLVKYDGIISLESNQSKEHDAYKWAKFREAMRLLTFNTSRNELKAAYKLIKSKRLAEII
ncbi:MAG: hypothetical protein QW112_04005, partial [Candidatus Micrarchaeia archaeon]